MKRFKMGVFNNLQLHDFDIKEYMKSVNEKIQTGFKLDKNNNYDMQQKRLVPILPKPSMSLTPSQNTRWKLGLQTKLTQQVFFCWMEEII